MFAWMIGWVAAAMCMAPNPSARYPGGTAQDQVIRVSSGLVLVPVLVTDPEGAIIRNLTIEDFEVEENGRTVSVARVGEPGEAPLELAMLYDVSGSVHPRFELERQAAAGFLRRVLRPADSVVLISVGDQPRVLAHRTSDLHEALAALERVEPAVEATAFFDCVAAAVSALRAVNRPEVRRVIIALSDGEDNRSTDYRLDQVLREIQESDCLFYSINPSGRSIRINPAGLLGQQGMEAIARGTGGATFVTDRLEELDAFYKRIAAELQGQYLLGYYSPSPEGEAYRRISVRIANRPELRVRARQGYYPS